MKLSKSDSMRRMYDEQPQTGAPKDAPPPGRWDWNGKRMTYEEALRIMGLSSRDYSRP